MAALRGLHVKTLTPAVDATLQRARPALVKTLDHRGDWAARKRASGITFLLGRSWLDPWADLAPTPEAAAERLFGMMQGEMIRQRGVYDAWETPWNERYASGAELRDHARAVRRFCDLARGIGVAVAVGNFSVGTPEPTELASVAEVMLGGAAYLSLHEYWLPGRFDSPWWVGRWRRLLDALPARLRRPVLITECGIDGGLDTPHRPAPQAGWRAYNVTPPTYVQQLDAYAGQLGPEVVGMTVFNAGTDDPQWLSFEVANVAEVEWWLAAGPRSWSPPTPPPVTPPPPPAGGTMPDYFSPNHDGQRTQTLGVVIHSTRGGASTGAAEYQATLNWFANPAAQVSAHAVVGPAGEVARPVDPALIAWHARSYNQTHLGIELVQPRAGDPLPPATLGAAARVVAAWCVRYKIPIDWSTTRGLAEHREIPPGVTDGKTDVGAPFDRAAFLAAVRREAQALAPAPALNVGELLVFPSWAQARLANKQDFRGAAGLADFRAHLGAIGCDATTPARYGWPA